MSPPRGRLYPAVSHQADPWTRGDHGGGGQPAPTSGDQQAGHPERRRPLPEGAGQAARQVTSCQPPTARQTDVMALFSVISLGIWTHEAFCLALILS